MKLEDQVCSLELAKRLKELRVKQESIWYWRYLKGTNPEWDLAYMGNVLAVNQKFSAFTVAELGEMLPMMVDGKRVEFWKFPYGWTIRYEPVTKDDYQVYFTEDDTEADARAKMLIYLLENDLIN